MKRSVGILIFEDAEVLDFAGPFEVFSVASQVHDYTLFDVFTIGKTKEPISAVNGLMVLPDYTFENCPKTDILIISGGQGTGPLVEDKETLEWVNKMHLTTEKTVSICSGSRILGTLGLLNGLDYCTHHLVYEDMEKMVPTGIPQKDKRYTNSGKIYTTGGISAGIDASFHIVEKIHGTKVAEATAKYMEYNRVENN